MATRRDPKYLCFGNGCHFEPYVSVKQIRPIYDVKGYQGSLCKY